MLMKNSKKLVSFGLALSLMFGNLLSVSANSTSVGDGVCPRELNGKQGVKIENPPKNGVKMAQVNNQDFVRASFTNQGKTVSWSVVDSANYQLSTVCVKGGTKHNFYSPASTSGEAPLNNGGQQAEISHVTFYYEAKEVPPVVEEEITNDLPPVGTPNEEAPKEEETKEETKEEPKEESKEVLKEEELKEEELKEEELKEEELKEEELKDDELKEEEPKNDELVAEETPLQEEKEKVVQQVQQEQVVEQVQQEQVVEQVQQEQVVEQTQQRPEIFIEDNQVPAGTIVASESRTVVIESLKPGSIESSTESSTESNEEEIWLEEEEGPQGAPTITEDTKEIGEETIPQSVSALPKTGEDSSAPTYLIGMVLLVIGLFLRRFQKRTNVE